MVNELCWQLLCSEILHFIMILPPICAGGKLLLFSALCVCVIVFKGLHFRTSRLNRNPGYFKLKRGQQGFKKAGVEWTLGGNVAEVMHFKMKSISVDVALYAVKYLAVIKESSPTICFLCFIKVSVSKSNPFFIVFY